MYNQLKALLELFEISLSGKRILDFGCGAGAFSLNLLRLGANEIVGVDVDQKLLDIAKLRVGDFYTDGCTLRRIGYVNKHSGLPLQSESFDIVWPHAVMEHVFPKDRKYVLSELWRVLKKNGHLIIDATPNRLWIKESHTTGIYFLNYLPLRMACYLARKFSERVSENESVESLLSRGIRGCTYWEIHKRLPASLCLNNVLRKRELNVFMSAWLHQGDSIIKGKAKKTFGKLMSSLDTILKLVHIPQTAFLPTHIMLFKKTSSPTS